MSQWAEHDGQAFAWVSVDDKDNDPKVLLTYIAQALDRVEPVGRRVFDALGSRASSVPGSVAPRLAAAFAAMTAPVVLAIDDVHLLHDAECRAALSVLADHVPPGFRLALAGRAAPPLRVARLRAEGRITEVGPADLALTRGETAALLRAAEVTVGDDDVAALHQRTEGWAVGLYLAVLALRAGGSVGTAAVSFGGDDRLVSDYVEAELLAPQPVEPCRGLCQPRTRSPAPGRDRRLLCRRPDQRGASPCRPEPRRPSGGAPGTHERVAPAAVDDLCASPLGRPAPHCAHPRAPCAC